MYTERERERERERDILIIDDLEYRNVASWTIKSYVYICINIHIYIYILYIRCII